MTMVDSTIPKLGMAQGLGFRQPKIADVNQQNLPFQ
jgi:hypothetical protein